MVARMNVLDERVSENRFFRSARIALANGAKVPETLSFSSATERESLM